MNKNVLMILLAVGTSTGILIGSLSYTNVSYASTLQQRQACADKYLPEILQNMILALEELGQMILGQEYTLDHRLETPIFLRILC